MSSEDEVDQLPDEKGPESSSESDVVVFENFRLSGCLNPPHPTNFTTNELSLQVRNKTIDLNPEYQREFVWSLKKQVALIDSIFKNYYVPPIILAVMSKEDGTEEKVCIDGKQRLTTINAFLTGFIYYHDPETGRKLFYTNNPSISVRKKRLLPDRYKKVFASRPISCMEFRGLADGEIRDMFQRVQRGMSLNTAEKIQAIPGDMTDFIKELDQNYFLDPDKILGERLLMNEKRGATFHNLAQFMFMYERWPARHTAPTFRELETWLSGQEPSDNLQKKLRSVLKYFTNLARDPKCMALMKRKEIFAPVEFIFSCFIVMLHKSSLIQEEIARGIGLMRNEVRIAFPSQVRTNKACCELIAEFITDLTVKKMDEKEAELKALLEMREEDMQRQREERRLFRLAAKGVNVDRGEDGAEAMDIDADADMGTKSVVTPKKRKRVDSNKKNTPN